MSALPVEREVEWVSCSFEKSTRHHGKLIGIAWKESEAQRGYARWVCLVIESNGAFVTIDADRIMEKK